jgi:hypothetical protein
MCPGFRDEYNGVWIGWLDLLVLLFQLLLIAVTYNSSQSVTAQDSSHSLLDHEHLSSIVPDSHEWRLSYESFLRISYRAFYNLERTGNRTLPWTVRLLYCAYLLSRERVLIPRQPIRCVGNMLSEALPSNGVFRLSGFLTQSSCKRASTPQQPCVSKPLPSNWGLILLDYSGFQPSSHSMT